MRGWWASEETAKLLVLQAHHEKLLIVLIFHLSSILDEELLNCKFCSFATSWQKNFNFVNFAIFTKPSRKVVNFVNFSSECNPGHKWLHRKERSKNKDLKSHLVIKLRTTLAEKDCH